MGVGKAMKRPSGARALMLAVACMIVAAAVITPAALASSSQSGRLAASAASTPAWLAEINSFRIADGLSPVTDNPAWDLGIKHHLTYLQRTPAQYMTGQYASAHTENPASPYYTSDGAAEASYSDLALGDAHSDMSAIDVWLAAPFHAVGMLRAQLTQVALADDPRSGYAGLDVIHGLNPFLPLATQPILYPGPGTTTNLVTYGGELPSPLQTCHWSLTGTYGLPLIVLLTQPPSADLSATLTGPQGTESTAAGSLCAVDENDYYSSDSVYGPTGLSILQGDNAVFLIPRHPLSTGSYAAALDQPGQSAIDWSFSAVAPVTRTTILSLHVDGHSVHIQLAAPTGLQLRCALNHLGRHGFGKNHFRACSSTLSYPHLRQGRFRLTVSSTAGTAIRKFRVH
jgi:hypothetical protein